MSLFDIVVIVIITAFVINGLRNGFFHEVLGLVGFIGGIFAAILGAGPVASWIHDNIIEISEVPLLLICFALLFGGFYYLSRSLASLLKKSVEKIFLGWLNKLLGGITAGTKAALIISLVLMYASLLPIHSWFDDYQDDSYLYEPLADLVPSLYRAIGSPEELPDEVRRILDKGREEILDEAIDEVRENVEDRFK